MIQKNVIHKTTKKVLRFGFTDFENDGSFDSINEEIIEKYFTFKPSLRYQDWFYNSATNDFQITAP